jgi:hypothetical protein
MKQELNERRPRRRRRIVLSVLLLILVAPFAIPENARIPVQGASVRDWNPRAFWYEPWGASGVHKGIDIFAPRGRPVIASVPRPWKATTQTQGWKRMFFVDPGALIGGR